MRLKTLNVVDRSDQFSPETGELVKRFTGNINKVGTLFDKFIEIETFIMTNVVEELEELVEVRSKREEIENNKENYINDYFIPAAKKIEEKINVMIEEWDLMNDDFDSKTINKIGGLLQKFKNFTESLVSEDTCLDTVDTIRKIIDDFGRFRSIRCMTSNNIVEKIEMLLKSKENIIKIKEDATYLEEIEIDDLSIDDLSIDDL